MASPMVDFEAEYGYPLRIAPSQVCAIEVLVCNGENRVLLVTAGSKYVVGSSTTLADAIQQRDAVETKLYALI